MRERRGYFDFALYLTLAVVLIHSVPFFYLLTFSFDVAKSAVGLIVGPILIFCGLWLLSKVARYVGPIWLLLTGGLVVWQLLFVGKIVALSAIWAIVLVLANLLLCWMLIFSKQFGAEFAERRRAEPRYKTVLRGAVVGLVVIVMLIATANDIIHLFQL
jgi:hypothetical protein